jgi:hypothetical protein
VERGVVLARCTISVVYAIQWWITLAFNKLIIKENIYTGFRGTRLVLYNLEVVILKLNIVLYILTLLKLENTL